MNTGRETAPRRILICRTDRLGDVVLALPCATLLKTLWPKCSVSFLVQSYTAPVVKMFPTVDEVIEVEKNAKVRQISRLVKIGRFDVAVALYPVLNVAAALFAAQVPVRSGIAYRWYSPLFNHRHREHRKLNLKHEAEYNLSLTYSTFQKRGEWEEVLPANLIFPVNFDLPETARRTIYHLLRDVGSRIVLVIHPGGGGSAYRWPKEFYCDLVRKVIDLNNVSVFITGVKGEEDLCHALTEAAGPLGNNLCGRLDLPELTALLNSCSLLLTNSTGPLHLARALGTPVLGLFPSTPAMTPARWGPYGLPNQVITPSPGLGMESISVDAVYQKAIELLKGKL
ncbi:MAG: glycosyltransferase family 9 protein [bacterium]|nr:glycosyltransferase family 9 protein [bacterium]